MRARNVLLALVIIAVGMTMTASRRGVFSGWKAATADWLGNIEDLEPLASKWRLAEGEWQQADRFPHDLPAAGVKWLTIRNPNGKVTVTGQAQDSKIEMIKVVAVRYGRAKDFDQALYLSRRASLLSHRSDDSLTIEVRGPGDFWKKARMDLEVTALSGLNVAVYTASGSVEVENVRGSVAITTASGDITIAGGSRAQVASASGSINIEGMEGPIEAKSVSGSLTLAGVQGEMKANTISGSIHGRGLRGPLSAETVSGDVALDNYQGHPATIQTTSGEVDALLSRVALEGQFSAHSVSGSIWVLVEPRSDCIVDVHSVSSGVRTEIGLPSSANRGPNRVYGALGDGRGRLELRSISGSITVTEKGRRAEAELPREVPEAREELLRSREQLLRSVPPSTGTRPRPTTRHVR